MTEERLLPGPLRAGGTAAGRRDRCGQEGPLRAGGTAARTPKHCHRKRQRGEGGKLVMVSGDWSRAHR